jgi:outer membrane murein-binding lipoprotein Lpp
MKNLLSLCSVAVLLCGCVPKSEVEKAQNDLAAARAKIQLLESELRQTQAELKTAHATLAKKPALPVQVTFRKAAMGPGYVAIVSTTIKKDFPVLVHVASKAIDRTKEFRLDLSFTHPTEIGHVEGAPIEDGDQVEITNNDYEPLVVVFSRKQ